MTLVSCAFALLYALRSLVEVMVPRHQGDGGNVTWFTMFAVLAFTTATLRIPAVG
ncbi:MAG: hypothetical protein AAF590_09695 [Pseudomonadota bacterium]